MKNWLRSRRFKKVVVVVALAAAIIGAHAMTAPAAHASGNGHYQSNYGRWHASIDLSNCVWGEGQLNCTVSTHCWVDGLGQYVGWDTVYRVACNVWRNNNLVDWANSSRTQHWYDSPIYGRATGVDRSFGGVGGDYWEAQIPWGYICTLDPKGSGACVTIDSAPNPNVIVGVSVG